jgi:hypothetical protein
VLSPADAVGYAALHLKHLLHGVRNRSRVQIASFLHEHADDGRSGRSGADCISPVAELETVSFLLAEAWFGFALAPAVWEEAGSCGRRGHGLKEFATSCRAAFFHPSKDELWLHLGVGL